ncbi:MAG: thermonuclease family protein [Gemmatimonadales bacterium]|nr:MAG: thermonuclease family protein [Gemmatimonadales bacterium]
MRVRRAGVTKERRGRMRFHWRSPSRNHSPLPNPYSLCVLVLLATLGDAACSQHIPRSQCVVARVVDGDTIHCRGGLKVRLIGIDSPERDQGLTFTAARTALAELLPDTGAVWLEQDVVPTDRYGRTLAYIWAGQVLVNERMLERGWAVLYTVPPNVRYVDRFRAAESVAREARRGLWESGGLECAPQRHRRGEC